MTNLYWSIIYPEFETRTVALRRTTSRHKFNEPSGNITRPSSDPARSKSAPGDLREQFAVAESMHVWLSTRATNNRRPTILISTMPTPKVIPKSESTALMSKIFNTSARKASIHLASSGRITNLIILNNDIHITNKFSNTKFYWIRTGWPTTNLPSSVVGRV